MELKNIDYLCREKMTDELNSEKVDKTALSLYHQGVESRDSGEINDALISFYECTKTAPACPLGWYGMANIYYNNKQEYDSAFKYSLQGVKAANLSVYPEYRYLDLGKILFDSANKLLKGIDITGINKNLAEELEHRGKMKIYYKDYIQSEFSSFLGFGPNYPENHHCIVYNSELPDYGYRILHELTYLKLLIHNYELGVSFPFTFGEKVYQSFFSKNIAKYQSQYGSMDFKLLNRMISKHFTILFAMLTTSIVDMFVDYEIYSHMENVRPYQLLSLVKEVERQDERVQKLKNEIPQDIFDVLAILSHLGHLNLQELYGVYRNTEILLSPASEKNAKEIFQIYMDAIDKTNYFEHVRQVLDSIAERLDIRYFIE